MSKPPPSAGSLLDGKYRLTECIGGGGMALVYRAEDVIACRTVAVKLLLPDLADDEELAKRFLHEARALDRIRHPNVVDVIEAVAGEAGPYLVLEHLDGESVGAALERVGRFEVQAALAILISVLEALDGAHRAGVIHRDLKPDNVFIARTTDGAVVVRLLDFGVAKVLQHATAAPRTRTGIVYGTPDYLSPEQATGDVKLDGRSDLIAAGVLLYEMLTGVRPFRGPTAVATAYRVVHAAAPSLAEAGVVVDPRLEALVARLLEKDRSRRHPSAAMAVVDLLELAAPPADRQAALARLLPAGARGRPGRARPARPRADPASYLADTELAMARPTSTRMPLGAAPIRPALPSRFQVRGSVFRSIDRALAERYGRAVREAIIARMPQDRALELRNDALNPLTSYGIDTLDLYMSTATRMAVRDAAGWNALGWLAVTGELAGLLRSALYPIDHLGRAFERAIPSWTRLMNFGAYVLDRRSDGVYALTVEQLEPASVALRSWLAGMVEETIRRAVGRALGFTIESGLEDLAAEMVCTIQEEFIPD